MVGPLCSRTAAENWCGLATRKTGVVASARLHETRNICEVRATFPFSCPTDHGTATTSPRDEAAGQRPD